MCSEFESALCLKLSFLYVKSIGKSLISAATANTHRDFSNSRVQEKDLASSLTGRLCDAKTGRPKPGAAESLSWCMAGAARGAAGLCGEGDTWVFVSGTL